MRSARIRFLLLFGIIFGSGILLSLSSAAHAISVDIIIPETDPVEVPAFKRLGFEAVCYDDTGKDVTADTSFIWEFGDESKPDRANPTVHR